LNQRLFVEFTALVAAQAPLVIEGLAPIPDGLLSVYWQHSQAVLRHWRREMQAAERASQADDCDRWHAMASNVLVSEMLTRVWGAVLTASDRRQPARRSEPIARSVLVAHQQCRAEVLRFLLHSKILPVEQLADLDRLRRRVERWTDLLVGPLILRYGEEPEAFAFDARRARDFGQDQFQARFHSSARPAWSFLLAGLRTAFPGDSTNRRTVKDPMMPILRAVLATFPDDAFQAEGAIKSLRAVRLSRDGQFPDRPFTNPEVATRKLRRDDVRPSRHIPLRS
jgi:hypothetical protein